MHQCAFCSEPAVQVKYFTCPKDVWRPNSYFVCQDHVDSWLTWDDVYPETDSKVNGEPE
jgi:hypothetical protein